MLGSRRLVCGCSAGQPPSPSLMPPRSSARGLSFLPPSRFPSRSNEYVTPRGIRDLAAAGPTLVPRLRSIACSVDGSEQHSPHSLCLSGNGIIGGMNKLSIDRRCRVVAALVEGNSIRATARMTGVSEDDHPQADRRPRPRLRRVPGRDAPRPQLPTAGVRRDLAIRLRQAEERREGEAGAAGSRRRVDVGRHRRGIEADPGTWYIGPRDAHSAHAFMTDLAGRLRHRIQLTTDGHRALRRGGGVGVRLRDRLRPAVHQGLRPRPRGRAALQPGRLHQLCREARSWATRTRSGSRPATSSGRTSRCGCRSAATPA